MLGGVVVWGGKGDLGVIVVGNGEVEGGMK